MSERFRVMSNQDAVDANVPGYDDPRLDFGWALVEFDDDKPVRVVGWDGGEPEDQLLVRDWDWVAPELNAQAATIAALRATVAGLEADVAEAQRLERKYRDCLAMNNKTINRRREREKATEAERDAAYAALRGCVHALGNGSGISEAASVEFHLLAPQEVAMCVERITTERDAARADALAASNHYMRIAAVRDAQAEALRAAEAERDALLAAVAECSRLAGEIVDLCTLDDVTALAALDQIDTTALAIIDATAIHTAASAATTAAGRK